LAALETETYDGHFPPEIWEHQLPGAAQFSERNRHRHSGILVLNDLALRPASFLMGKRVEAWRGYPGEPQLLRSFSLS